MQLGIDDVEIRNGYIVKSVKLANNGLLKNALTERH